MKGPLREILKRKGKWPP